LASLLEKGGAVLSQEGPSNPNVTEPNRDTTISFFKLSLEATARIAHSKHVASQKIARAKTLLEKKRRLLYQLMLIQEELAAMWQEDSPI
jgi:hypothetical protein